MTRPVCEDTFLIKYRNLKNNYFAFTFAPFSQTAGCRPGSFVHVRLPRSNVFFRRAMSVAGVDRQKKELEIIFRVFGRGTHILSGYRRDARVDLLGPLGNSFTPPRRKETVVIIAGGVGFPPLLYLATDLVSRGFDPGHIEFFYGGRNGGDIIERTRIRKLGVKFRPVTDDGSYGRQGLVTELVEEYIRAKPGKPLRLYGCGPEAMLKATDDLGRRYALPGQLSLEAPMPCGYGVCLGCVVPLRKGGHARVCAEGPVFDIGEVLL
jgi:dihydroorotate dehydrogenase electron transfer subunit